MGNTFFVLLVVDFPQHLYVVKVEQKLLLDSGIQQKKVGLAEIHHFAKCTFMVMQEDSTMCNVVSSCEFF